MSFAKDRGATSVQGLLAKELEHCDWSVRRVLMNLEELAPGEEKSANEAGESGNEEMDLVG